MVRPVKFFSAAEMLLACALFLLIYSSIGLSGIFVPFPLPLIRILHEPPSLIALSFLLVIVVIRLFSCLKLGKGMGRRGMLTVLIYIGTILTITGIITGSLVRFEGRILLPEGEAFNGNVAGYLDASVYSGKLATPPAVALRLVNLEPSFRKGGMEVRNIHAAFILAGQADAPERRIKVNSALPSYAEGVFYRIRSFGYAPLYRLSDSTGKILDEAYPMLRLFPPGAEDYFRLEKQPYTFYLKFYPARDMIMETRVPVPQETQGPIYKLRVARNLDVVFNGYIVPHEIYQVDAVHISFEDMRKWAEIEIVKDYGLFLMIPGMGMVFTAFLLARLRGVKLLKEILSPYRQI